MPTSWSYHMTRASRRPTASHVALVLIALVLAVLVFASFASRAVGSAMANPVLLSLAGTDADEILVLDPRSGTVLNRIANPTAAVRQIFLVSSRRSGAGLPGGRATRQAALTSRAARASYLVASCRIRSRFDHSTTTTPRSAGTRGSRRSKPVSRHSLSRRKSGCRGLLHRP